MPDGIAVVDVLVNRWTAVRTDAGTVGLAMSCEGGPRSGPDVWKLRGRSLREVAACSMSWDLRLASVGVAALNAWYASPERLAALGVSTGPAASYFARHSGELGRVATAVVGHFRDVEGLSGDVKVLERRPRGSDLPDPACEYVLPGCQRVVISGSALVNKTLPRLLQLAAGAEVHLVGPSASPAPGAYPSCVREIAGSMVVDPDECWHLAGLGGRHLVRSSALEMFSLSLDAPSS